MLPQPGAAARVSAAAMRDDARREDRRARPGKPAVDARRREAELRAEVHVVVKDENAVIQARQLGHEHLLPEERHVAWHVADPHVAVGGPRQAARLLAVEDVDPPVEARPGVREYTPARLLDPCLV
eukprot:scaffold73962_cov68-Phaeocystis_antarctica.AAC.2